MSKPYTVVIVDDDRATRELILDRIKVEDGFQCLETYSDPEAAIKGILEVQPDLVLMDINMPGKTGIECVRELKPQLTDTDFIMLTVYDESEFIFEALKAGAIGYLLKRNVSAELITELRKAVDGGSPIDSTIARLVVESFQKPKKNQTNVVEILSERQLEVLKLIAQGLTDKAIAGELEISIHTVNNYTRKIYEKLHVNSRAEAAAKLSQE
jgi:DNA-binding NarL/FixJ family response regulator